MMTPQISVIVPVYKAEKYLHRCVDSILAQTFQDFEVLLIDDGSPDRSGEICDEYAEKDSRIRVIHKENGGVGSARNIGLRYAKKEYIWFIDADDYIENNAIEILSNELGTVDIIAFNYRLVSEKDGIDFRKLTIFKSTGGKILSGHDFMNECLTSKLFVWNFIYSRPCLLNSQVEFSANMKFGEDALFNINILPTVNRVKYINSCLYNYVQHSSSTMQQVSQKKIEDTLILLDGIISIKKRIPTISYLDNLITSVITNRFILLSKSDYASFRALFLNGIKERKINKLRIKGNNVIEKCTAFIYNISPQLCLYSYIFMRNIKK